MKDNVIFRHSFDEPIWKILPTSAPDKNLWAVETRNGDSKQVKISLLDLDANELIWQKNFALGWWTFLTEFVGDFLLFHKYARPQHPEPTDLIVISVRHAQAINEIKGCFVKEVLDNERVIIQHQGEDNVSVLALANTLVEMDDQPRAERHAANLSETYLPRSYDSLDPYFVDISKFLKEIATVSAVFSVDYLEHGPLLAMSYYIYKNNQYAQYIIVVNRLREVIHHEFLSFVDEIKNVVPFLISHHRLVFTKGNKEFVSINL